MVPFEKICLGLLQKVDVCFRLGKINSVLINPFLSKLQL